MERQIGALSLRKAAHVALQGIVQPHALQRLSVYHRRQQHLAAVLETDEAAVEQMVDVERNEDLNLTPLYCLVTWWLARGNRMANAVFTTSESSIYDDLPEVRYHFPHTYLRQAEAAIDDWILYYEPRRTEGPASSGGRQAYFATARVIRIDPDEDLPNHYYAYVDSYLELDHVVPFRNGYLYRESMLRKADGSTNKGAFGRSIRQIPADEFASILEMGFTRSLAPWEEQSRISEPVPEYVNRPIVEQVINRKFRDQAFRRHVRAAYRNTCALTGLRLINGGGRPEVQAAHIRSVEEDGPDIVRNGIALTGTAHWLFDRGLISFEDDGHVLRSSHGLPSELERLMPADGKLILPEELQYRPHPTYLQWHRNHRFKP